MITDLVAPDVYPREILVLRRAKGYLRLHLPPLMYMPTLARTLERGLIALKGVRRVKVDRGRARLSVFYDPWLTDDRPALLEIDRQATPALETMAPASFEKLLVKQYVTRRKRLAGKAVKASYLGAVVWVHWYLLHRWLDRPLRFWWAWSLIAFGLWLHQRQIRSIPKLTP